MKSTSKNGPSASSNGLGGSGARDESSVLFSLGALMAKGEEEARGAAARDESGLIDIKALAAAAAREPAKAAPPEVHVDIFPFEAPLAPPPVNAVAPAEALGEPPVQKSSRRGLFVMGALIMVGVAGAIGILLNAPGAPAVAAAESLGAVAESARQGTAAIPPPVAAPSQIEAKTPPQTPSRPEVRTQRTASQQTSNTPQTTPAVPKAETTPAKPPAKDPCGGDLMCAMQRAARKP